MDRFIESIVDRIIEEIGETVIDEESRDNIMVKIIEISSKIDSFNVDDIVDEFFNNCSDVHIHNII